MTTTMRTPARALATLLFLGAGCARSDADAIADRPAAPSAAAAVAAADGAKPLVHVWKSPTCGCCAAWVEHLRAAGYPVRVEDVADVDPVKRRFGVPGAAASCHTAQVDGYLVEGHVPADAIDRMLAERPEIAGLAVPGMPMGSPGMAAPGEEGGYEIVALTRSGALERYERR